MIGQSEIERVRSETNIIDLIDCYTVLTEGKKSLYHGKCPMCNSDKFSASYKHQAYYCFGCRRGGNVFTFLRDKLGLNFADAFRFLDKEEYLRAASEQGKEWETQ